ncbi:DUF7475 family protein [Halovivax gelatinilyticus]|uniref:DUF7475 family protein n=1 Tax=Halovivax gelatinilyticus TaxID=2961597 RepID=UPI0020CA4546|nr:hypothetical protein [Halovivax gelatinilyticus]
MARRVRRSGLSALQWVAVALVVATGGVHLGLGVVFLPEPLAVAFVLAGLGYAGALILFAFDVRRRLLYLAGVPFVGAQIVAWYALNRPSGVDDLSVGETADKLVQLALIVVLIVLYRRDDRSTERTA